MEKDEAIPVLLGAAFRPYYGIGDEISGEYLFYDYTFQVIGFLDDTSEIQRGDISYSAQELSEYVIMPSFSFLWSPQSTAEYDHQKLHLANRVSGKVYVTPSLAPQVSDWLSEETAAAGLGEFWITQSTWGQLEYALGLTLSQFIAVSAGILLLSSGAFGRTIWRIRKVLCLGGNCSGISVTES